MEQHHPVRPAENPAWLKFWGVRGSIPTPGAGTVRYGGNTSCVEMRVGGQHLILDAGSGIRPLGLALLAEKRDLDVTLLLTHTHWDHIQGFPFFVPAYQARHRIHIMGYEGALHDLQTILAGQMENPYFPVALAQMPGNLIIEELKCSEFKLGSLSIHSCKTKHPGLTVGYRVDSEHGSVCYIPDHESTPGENWKPLDQLMAGADVLMLDSQYTAEEYPTKKGWGHGCVDDVVRVAREAGVKRLFLFHHDPSHDDEFLDRVLERARSMAGPDLIVNAAREGDVVELAKAGAQK